MATNPGRAGDASTDSCSPSEWPSAGGRGGSALTSRPNDGTGYWPDFSNTGYLYSTATPTSTAIPCTHGYAGMYDYAASMPAHSILTVTGAGTATFNCYHFRGKVQLGGTNWTFNKCVFDGTWPNDNMVIPDASVVTVFNYCTFRPAEWRSPVTTPQGPPGNPGNISSDHSAPGTPYTDSFQLVAGTGTVQMTYCDVWGNAGMEVLNGSSGLHAIFNRCYIHDQSDTDGSGGSGYHNDGIGPDSTGPEMWNDITNCTIASLGNTNAIAFQGTNACHDNLITGNYISGWGIAVSLGAGTSYVNDYNVTFTGNIYSCELAALFGPLYGNWTWNSAGGGSPGTGMLWRNNFYQVRAGDGNANYVVADNGMYWWPTDNNPHATEYTG